MYESVLQLELGDLAEFIRASKPRRVLVALSRAEVDRLLGALEETRRLITQTLYGTGMCFVRSGQAAFLPCAAAGFSPMMGPP